VGEADEFIRSRVMIDGAAEAQFGYGGDEIAQKRLAAGVRTEDQSIEHRDRVEDFADSLAERSGQGNREKAACIQADRRRAAIRHGGLARGARDGEANAAAVLGHGETDLWGVAVPEPDDDAAHHGRTDDA
jgi:hypothetical protein